MSKAAYNFVLDEAPEFETTVSPSKMKIKLRRENLIRKDDVNVLETNHHYSDIWKAVKKGLKRNVNVLSISKTSKTLLQGDSVKYVKSLDLSQFDIIDVDSDGSPFKVLKALFNNRSIKNVRVFFTLRRIMGGGLDNRMLYDLGFSKRMVKAVRSILKPKTFDLFKGWLGKHGVKHLKYYHLRYSWGVLYCGFFDFSRVKK